MRIVIIFAMIFASYCYQIKKIIKAENNNVKNLNCNILKKKNHKNKKKSRFHTIIILFQI